jgi:hypothetical protein
MCDPPSFQTRLAGACRDEGSDRIVDDIAITAYSSEDGRLAGLSDL